jgi:hypothetical protein
MEILGTEEGAVDCDPNELEEQKISDMIEVWRKCDKEKENTS